ncbi:C-1-tetrahydrofolate synthase, cytoplasmic [Chondrus crispus]|uniref:C-1-tetrahydrofolate synthase, cytoplasmic n=1 Tax=Chondrus crispus TaxID=2769 RepID=R7QM84_CHOCR|nr:C-1-tetrahydrofolate synthase, cytoplasmic [Chondrus crispus]CDF38888.1 C-1-tetrahydrofolate synthase, cytoplasmic [Chondrus crispus]|eukprot:XP_005718793.1 C-1-tetrahydrofolate synthase, cytoplasmic [Chondrus crispus]
MSSQEENDGLGGIIDGKAIAAEIRAEIRNDVSSLSSVIPGLATVLVGERKDSATYVRMKIKACSECGMESIHRALPADATEGDIIAVVRALNEDACVHGILVQLPLPDGINEENVLSEISIEKDVDGFHPLNIGKLAMRGREPLFAPCTPRGCIELLKRSGVEISGKEAVVVGRSNIVGLPVSLLLMHENATVTITHSRTVDLASVVRRADIVVAAVGRTEMVKADWLKPGCVVIDVGMNSKPDSTRKSGYRLVGDVDFEGCRKKASLVTPVPGGVGPMTIAMLLRNCADAAMKCEKSAAQ